MLTSSSINRNVFVGNLSYKVDQFVLKTLFETLVVNEQRDMLTVTNYSASVFMSSDCIGNPLPPELPWVKLALCCNAVSPARFARSDSIKGLKGPGYEVALFLNYTNRNPCNYYHETFSIVLTS